MVQLWNSNDDLSIKNCRTNEFAFPKELAYKYTFFILWLAPPPSLFSPPLSLLFAFAFQIQKSPK